MEDLNTKNPADSSPYHWENHNALIQPHEIIATLCQSSPEQYLWKSLFKEFLSLTEVFKMPSKKWYIAVEEIIRKIGFEEFEKKAVLISSCNMARLEVLGNKKYFDQGVFLYTARKNFTTPTWLTNLTEESVPSGWFIGKQAEYGSIYGVREFFYSYFVEGKITRGIFHANLIIKSPAVDQIIDCFANMIPAYAQDAFHIYSVQNNSQGISKLVALRRKVNNKTSQKRIDKAIANIGRKRNLSSEQLIEETIPTHDVNQNGLLRKRLSKGEAVVTMDGLSTPKITFMSATGKLFKTLPKDIDEGDLSITKELRKTVKQIASTLVSTRHTIEGFYRSGYKVDFDRWVKFYAQHPLVNRVVTGSLWVLSSRDTVITGLFQSNQFIDVNERPISIESGIETVSLWHPALANPAEIAAWKSIISKCKFIQPFKQVYRETYSKTDIPEKNTDRYEGFNGHIINKDKLYALAKSRDWSTTDLYKQGDIRIVIKFFRPNIEAALNFRDIDLNQLSAHYGDLHARITSVTFSSSKAPLPIENIDPIVLSEILRDIDLFISTTSIGNDAAWFDSQLQEARKYVHKYTEIDLSGVAKTRAEILKNIILSLGKNNIRIERNFVCIDKPEGGYKIHLNSGNAFSLETNSLYPIDKKPKKISLKNTFIPIDGDTLIEEIIFKSMYLSEL
jgi:hypothetical protein